MASASHRRRRRRRRHRRRRRRRWCRRRRWPRRRRCRVVVVAAAGRARAAPAPPPAPAIVILRMGPSRVGRPRHATACRRTGSGRPVPARTSPRTSIATSAPSSTSGGRKARAMPWPSIGEKLPLVTTPASAPVDQHRLVGPRRAAALDGEAAQAAGDAALALGDQRVAPAEAAVLVPRHDPAEAGLERGDARARARGRGAAGRPRGGGCRGHRARRASGRWPRSASHTAGAASAGTASSTPSSPV